MTAGEHAVALATAFIVGFLFVGWILFWAATRYPTRQSETRFTSMIRQLTTVSWLKVGKIFAKITGGIYASYALVSVVQWILL